MDQLVVAVATPVYAFVIRSCCCKLIVLVMPLRATEHEEALGMDVVSHGEEAYVSGEGAILITEQTLPEQMLTDRM